MRSLLPAAALPFLVLAACSGESRREMNVAEVGGELAKMRINPGLWELRTEVVDVTGPDLPREVRDRMIGPRSRVENCISPEQAARPDANFLAGSQNRQCRYRDFAVENGRVSGDMDCGDASAEMQGSFAPDRYDMRISMDGPAPGGERMRLTLRASGRRIGECRESETGEGK